MRTLSALLRIVRPMRQRIFVIQGTEDSDGQYAPDAFDVPDDYVEL